MTKRKALKIILAVALTMFTTTATIVAIIGKVNGYDALNREYKTAPSITTTQASKSPETQTQMSLEEKRSKLMSKCQIQNNLSLDTIIKLDQEIIDEEDEGTQKYFLCIFQGVGILDEEGNLSVDATAIKQWIPGLTDEMLVAISEKCFNFDAPPTEDVGVLLMKCFLSVGKN